MSYYRPAAMTYKYGDSVIPPGVIMANTSKVEYSETEGFQIWYEGSQYPTNGIFDPFAQGALDPVKRYARNELRFCSRYPIRALSWFSSKFRKQWVDEFSWFCLLNLRGYVYRPEHWTRAVKEIYHSTIRLPDNIQDALCVFLEQDKPYRYRVQDILGSLDKESLEKNPRREIKKLIDLLIVRDRTLDWRKIGRLAKLALFIPAVAREVVFILTRIDPIAIALDNADLYNCLINGSENGDERYHFLGLNDEGMIKLHQSLCQN